MGSKIENWLYEQCYERKEKAVHCEDFGELDHWIGRRAGLISKVCMGALVFCSYIRARFGKL